MMMKFISGRCDCFLKNKNKEIQSLLDYMSSENVLYESTDYLTLISYILYYSYNDAFMSNLKNDEGKWKSAVEIHRRSMPFCMGTLYWQFNDCWPAISWSSLDYYGNWKALHYHAKRFLNPIILNSFLTCLANL